MVEGERSPTPGRASLVARLRARPDDWRNLAILSGVCVLLLLLVSPVHEYAVIDDWIYAQAVRHWQITSAFARPDWALVSLIAHTAWGVLFVTLFGYSFTVLTFSTLVLAYLGIVGCYALLRTLAISPGRALFGTLLLVLNPLYLHLSYSFMTDVPFTALITWSALLILWSLERNDDRLLLGAMLLSAVAGLVRQPGILPALVLGGYLLWTRQLSLHRAVILLLPVGIFGLYTLGQQGLPPNAANRAVDAWIGVSFAHPPLSVSLLGVLHVTVWAALGLWLVPLLPIWAGLRLGRSARWAMVVGGGLLLIAYAVLGTLGATMPLDLTGSVLTSQGFLLLAGEDSRRALTPILAPPVWLGLGLGMIVLTAWLTAVLGQAGITWLGRLWTHRPALDPAATAWGLGVLLLGQSFVTPFAADRYLLPALPFVLAACLRLGLPWTRRRGLGAGALLLVLGLGTVLLQADFADRAAARWEATDRLLAQGIPYSDIASSFEWDGMHYYDELGSRRADNRVFGQLGIRRDPDSAVGGAPISIPYTIGETVLPGYHPIGAVTYYTRLGGFTTRTVWMLARDGIGAVAPARSGDDASDPIANAPARSLP